MNTAPLCVVVVEAKLLQGHILSLSASSDPSSETHIVLSQFLEGTGSLLNMIYLPIMYFGTNASPCGCGNQPFVMSQAV